MIPEEEYQKEWWLVKLGIKRIRYINDPNPITEYKWEEITISSLGVKIKDEFIFWWEIDYIQTPEGKKIKQKDLFPKWRTNPEILPSDY